MQLSMQANEEHQHTTAVQTYNIATGTAVLQCLEHTGYVFCGALD